MKIIITPASLSEFERAYIQCALWSTNDESSPSGGNPLDQRYTVYDIGHASLLGMVRDCADFQAAHADLIARAIQEQKDLTSIAHDFWLTRNGHGAGFWDGDYSEDLGEKLTEAAKAFGECDLYVGDDGAIYYMGKE